MAYTNDQLFDFLLDYWFWSSPYSDAYRETGIIPFKKEALLLLERDLLEHGLPDVDCIKD